MNNFYSRRIREKGGVTVIELMVALAVFGIIVLTVLPQFSKIKENQVLKNATQDVLSTLAKARSQTLASLNSSEYGVHFELDKIIIFKGIAYAQGAAGNETINIISPASISNITLTGGAVDLYFNRLSGTPSVSGSVIVSSTNFTKTITISATGVASVN